MKKKLDLINHFRIEFHLSKLASFMCSEMVS